MAGLGVSLLDDLIQHADSKSGFSDSVVIDGFSLFSAGVFTVVGYPGGADLHGLPGLEHINFGEYYVLLLGTISGMMLMSAANSLIVIFLALELFSICLYVLAGFERTREKSLESAIKYFLLSAFASAFLLYGMALTYGATGSTMLRDIGAFLRPTMRWRTTRS